MTDDDAPPTFGTVAPDAPVSRADFERAIRHLNLSDLELRDAVLQLGARMVTLVDELTRRLDGVEPSPAPPGTPAPAPTRTVEEAAMADLRQALVSVRAADAATPWRVQLDTGADKYTVEPATPPCAEVIHLCEARCCSFDFALSTQDLDEGVIRWDHGQPYLIRQRASDGRCVHNDPVDHRCTVHDLRPRPCRTYHCKDDRRIWLDYERRIPAPPEDAKIPPPVAPPEGPDLVERARARAAAIRAERAATSKSCADAGPVQGPPPRPRGA